MRQKKQRKSTEQNEALTQNPFGDLSGLGDLPAGPEDSQKNAQSSPKKAANRGRVEIVRQTAHRGGKAVTVIQKFIEVDAEEIRILAKKLQKTCGAGGTVKDGRIEIQGDKREEVKEALIGEGFRPVFAGG